MVNGVGVPQVGADGAGRHDQVSGGGWREYEAHDQEPWRAAVSDVQSGFSLGSAVRRGK